jgi:hypothetical protein
MTGQSVGVFLLERSFVCMRGCDWLGVGEVGRHILAGTVLGVCAKVGVGVSDATGAGCGRSCLWGCHGFWSDEEVVAVVVCRKW